MSSTNSKDISAFRQVVWRYYRAHGRHDLPWRTTRDPYRILVSEVMLQQTQVPRVIEKYKSFIKKFPVPQRLAVAPLSDILKEWSGLGYNRRAKYLHDAAKVIAGAYGGNVRDALKHPLPGVGHYTQAAVRAFAFNEPEVLIETNIRTALIHHFCSSVLQKTAISDRELLPLVTKAATGQSPREWHWALMDYGAYLKKSGVRNNSRSAHYAKQSKFEGSVRQLRGEVLRQLHDMPMSGVQLRKNMARPGLAMARVADVLAGLKKDGLIEEKKGKWRIA